MMTQGWEEILLKVQRGGQAVEAYLIALGGVIATVIMGLVGVIFRDSILRRLDRIEGYFIGDGDNPGLLIRIDRLERKRAYKQPNDF